MRLKLTLALLLLNIVLFGAIIYLDKTADSERSFEEKLSLVLAPGLIDQAKALEVEGVGIPVNWRLERVGSAWKLVEPIQWRANDYAVESILSQLRGLRWETRFSVEDVERAGRSLADYGLESPRGLLRIEQQDGRTVTLQLGAPTQIGNRLYLLAEGKNEVLVVGRELLRTLSLSLEELRNPAIFTIQPYEVRSVAIQSDAGARVRLVKRDESRWEFESPIRVAASAGAVNSLISELLGVDVRKFVNPDLAEQGLVTPRMRLVVETGDTRQTLLLGQNDASSPGQVFAKLEDSSAVFTAPAELVERLQGAQEGLRERYFFDFDAQRLNEIQISVSKREVTLQKLETGGWQVIRQGEGGNLEAWPADPEVMERLVVTLANLYTMRFVSDAPAEADLASFGFNSPQRRVVVRVGDQTRTLLLGDYVPSRHTVFAKRVAEPFVYEVSAAILDQLQTAPLYYRLRVLETLPPAARVVSLRLSRVSQEQPLLEVALPQGSSWESVLQQYPDEERAAISSLLAFVRKSQVRQYVKVGFTDPMRLDEQESLPWIWKLEASVELPSGAGEARQREETFYFTDRIGGTTQFGGTQKHDVIFVLPQEQIDAMHALTFDRGEPAPESIPDLQQEEETQETDAGPGDPADGADVQAEPDTHPAQ